MKEKVIDKKIDIYKVKENICRGVFNVSDIKCLDDKIKFKINEMKDTTYLVNTDDFLEKENISKSNDYQNILKIESMLEDTKLQNKSILKEMMNNKIFKGIVSLGILFTVVNTLILSSFLGVSAGLLFLGCNALVCSGVCSIFEIRYRKTVKDEIKILKNGVVELNNLFICDLLTCTENKIMSNSKVENNVSNSNNREYINNNLITSENQNKAYRKELVK